MRRNYSGKKFAKGIVALIAAAAALFAFNKNAEAENDWVYRSKYKAVIPIRDDLKLTISPELRYRDDFSEYFRNQVDFSLGGHLTDWFSLTANYRIANERKNGVWCRQRRPHLNAIFNFELFGLAFSDRNRFEYRMNEDYEDHRIYRNKLSLKLPEFAAFKLRPYFAAEPYYDFEEDKITKTRLYVGTDIKVIDRLKLGIEYIWEDKDNGDNIREQTNFIRTIVEYAF